MRLLYQSSLLLFLASSAIARPVPTPTPGTISTKVSELGKGAADKAKAAASTIKAALPPKAQAAVSKDTSKATAVVKKEAPKLGDWIKKEFTGGQKINKGNALKVVGGGIGNLASKALGFLPFLGGAGAALSGGFKGLQTSGKGQGLSSFVKGALGAVGITKGANGKTDYNKAKIGGTLLESAVPWGKEAKMGVDGLKMGGEALAKTGAGQKLLTEGAKETGTIEKAVKADTGPTIKGTYNGTARVVDKTHAGDVLSGVGDAQQPAPAT